jgi:cell division protein FtsI (penicillin-binding protein 3)
MRLIERRIGLLFAGFLLLFTIILGRALWIQGVQGASLSSQALSQQTETITVPGLRGRLLDRRGRELAVSEDAASIYATPYQVKDPPRTARRLAPLLGLPPGEILKGLNSNSGFAYLARKVDLGAAKKIEAMHLPGIGQLPDSRRTYPQGDLAGQVIGAVGTDGQALTGLEVGENHILRGITGEHRVIKDALGQPIELQTVRPASDGHDVQLTLDSVLQQKTEEVLAGIGQTYSPKGATAIVMNPQTSQVLAMANWPPVNPSDLSNASNQDLENQATGFTYEPGSTFKAFTIGAALQDHLVTPDTQFHLEPTIQVADRTVHEAEARGPVDLTVAQILAESSNVGAVTIGLKLGAERFSQWVSRFGFGRTTGVQYPGEERGIVPPLDNYSGSSMGNLPIGQGISVTPMQMAAAYAAIADGGVLRRPQLVEKVGGRPVREPRGKRILKPQIASEVRQMLEGVLQAGGTASEVSVPGYVLAGKTGTAQVAVNGGYSNTRFVASFIGFAPASNPQLEVAVVVDEPQGDIYGGSVAAPAFGQIASFALPYLGIAPG